VRFGYLEYYRDRLSEYELCRDFPGDDILIDGLHSMQIHFINNGINLEIPIVRVMNTAHFLAAYMFATACSGDQTEYDSLADLSLGRDKKMFKVAIIVLAAMLRRTEGFRASRCRNVLLDNRDPDFEEGVTLYDRFLRSAEKRFAEEDFLIDIPALIQRNHELEHENQQLKTENNELKYRYELMEAENEKTKPQTIVYNYGTYIAEQNNDIRDCTIYTTAPSEQQPKQETAPAPDLFCRITQAAHDKGVAQQVENELRRACVSAPKLVKAIRTNEALGYLDTQDLSSSELFDMLNAYFGLSFKLRAFQNSRSR